MLSIFVNNIMKKPVRLFFVAPLVLLAACTTITPKRDFDRNASFDRYKTYSWAIEPNTLPPINPAVDQAIHSAVDKGLADRGYTKAEGKTPDIYVVYHVTSVQKTDVRHYTDWGFGTTYRPGYGFYVGWPGNPVTYSVLDQDKVGALILDFVEVRRNQLVWRGVASSAIGEKGGDNASRAGQAVKLLLAEFPPPATPAAR